MLGYFIDGCILIPKYLCHFINKFLPTCFIYSFIAAIPIGLAALALVFIDDRETASFVFKILFTIFQIIPLSATLAISQKDKECTAEFAIPITVIVVAAVWC